MKRQSNCLFILIKVAYIKNVILQKKMKKSLGHLENNSLIIIIFIRIVILDTTNNNDYNVFCDKMWLKIKLINFNYVQIFIQNTKILFLICTTHVTV